MKQSKLLLYAVMVIGLGATSLVGWRLTGAVVFPEQEDVTLATAFVAIEEGAGVGGGSDPCAGIICGNGYICNPYTQGCQPDPTANFCDNDPCAPGYVCNSATASCDPAAPPPTPDLPPYDPCAYSNCGPGYYCSPTQGGACIPENACANIDCGAGYSCVNGYCERDIVNPPPPADPCAGVNCGAGYICSSGTCVFDTTPPPPSDGGGGTIDPGDTGGDNNDSTGGGDSGSSGGVRRPRQVDRSGDNNSGDNADRCDTAVNCIKGTAICVDDNYDGEGVFWRCEQLDANNADCTDYVESTRTCRTAEDLGVRDDPDGESCFYNSDDICRGYNVGDTTYANCTCNSSCECVGNRTGGLNDYCVGESSCLEGLQCKRFDGAYRCRLPYDDSTRSSDSYTTSELDQRSREALLNVRGNFLDSGVYHDDIGDVFKIAVVPNNTVPSGVVCGGGRCPYDYQSCSSLDLCVSTSQTLDNDVVTIPVNYVYIEPKKDPEVESKEDPTITIDDVDIPDGRAQIPIEDLGIGCNYYTNNNASVSCTDGTSYFQRRDFANTICCTEEAIASNNAAREVCGDSRGLVSTNDNAAVGSAQLLTLLDIKCGDDPALSVNNIVDTLADRPDTAYMADLFNATDTPHFCSQLDPINSGNPSYVQTNGCGLASLCYALLGSDQQVSSPVELLDYLYGYSDAVGVGLSGIMQTNMAMGSGVEVLYYDSGVDNEGASWHDATSDIVARAANPGNDFEDDDAIELLEASLMANPTTAAQIKVDADGVLHWIAARVEDGEVRYFDPYWNCDGSDRTDSLGDCSYDELAASLNYDVGSIVIIDPN